LEPDERRREDQSRNYQGMGSSRGWDDPLVAERESRQIYKLTIVTLQMEVDAVHPR
jgi:hypothetical protein